MPLAVGHAVCRPLVLDGGCGRGGLLAADPGARGGRLGLDLLVGGGLGDDVLEELEVVLVGYGICWRVWLEYMV